MLLQFLRVFNDINLFNLPKLAIDIFDILKSKINLCFLVN